MSLKDRITDDMKTAMRGGDKLRLGTIRMLKAAIQQREVDDRRDMTDPEVLQIIEKHLQTDSWLLLLDVVFSQL